MSIRQLTIPFNTDVLIKTDDSVRLLNKIIDELDFSSLYGCYSRNGRPPKSPIALFKVLVYAYMNCKYSSRAIETACRRDVNFIWLLNGVPAPDHNTISRFRSGRLSEVMESLFYQLVKKLGELGEIEYKNIFIDGTKIEANANKYTFVWKKAVQKNAIRLDTKVKVLISEIDGMYGTTFLEMENCEGIKNLQDVHKFMDELRIKQEVEFVHGIGKRKSTVQKQSELLNEYIEKVSKYNDYSDTFGNRNSFSKTDKDATFMRMKDDHMRNSQLKPGYNVQIGVEGEYIVGADIFSERSDQLTLIPFMENIKENLGVKYTNIVADAGYESEENYLYLENESHTSYIKPSNYEITKKKSFKKKIEKRENMTYDESCDEYICHENRRLKFQYEKKRKSKSGFESKVKVYECESCEDCKIKGQCTKAKGNKVIELSPGFAKYREESLRNIVSEEGTKLRVNRSIQVEGAFGVIKQDYGFRKFMLRGSGLVKTEFLILSFGYNINKLHSKTRNKRNGVFLHELKIA